MNRQLNVKLLGFLVGAAALFALGIHLLHGFQERRNASSLLQQAERAEQDGKAEQAAQHLRTYLGFAPDDTDALTRYGLLLSRLASQPQARAQALEVLEQVLRRDPSRADVRRQLVDIAMHPQLARYADAREHLEILLRAPAAADGALYPRLAQCCAAGGDFAQAARHYEQAIDRDPAAVECYVALADLLRRRLDNAARAAEVLDQMVAANPRSPTAYLARCRIRLEVGQSEAAAADVAKARDLAPDHPEVLLMAGQLALGRSDPAEARRQFERGLQLQPQNAAFYLSLAELETRAQQPAEAVAVLRRGVTQLPEHTDLLWGLANLLIQQKQVPDAEMARLAQLHLPAAQRSFLQARILINQGQWLQAVRLLEPAQPTLRGWPDISKQADVLLGDCHGQLGNREEQYAAYRRAVQTDPLWEPACLGLAAVQASRGETDEALATYRRVLPRVPSVRIALARLLLARTRRLPAEQRRWEEIEKLLDEAAQVRPASADVAILRADILAERGQLGQAEEVLLGARDAYADRPEPWIALAGLALRQEKPADALTVLDAACARLGDRVELRLARAAYWVHQGGDEGRAALARLVKNLDDFTPEQRKQLLRGLAACFVRVGDETHAQAAWTRLAAEAPGDLNTRLALFDLALRAGKGEAVERLLKEMQAIEGPDGVHARYGRACWLIRQARQGDPAGLGETRKWLAQLASARPTWARVAVAQGEVAELDGDAAAALKHYQHAFDLGDRQPASVRRLVELLYQQRRYVEADEVLQKLPQGDDLAPDLRRIAAAISLQRHDPDRALKLARQAVPAGSKDYRDYLWLGQFLSATADKDQAETMLCRAVELAESAPDAWVALVFHYVRSGKKDRAAAALAQASDKLGRDEAAVGLAACHEALGQPEEARWVYTAAVTARPDDVALRRSLVTFCLRFGPPAEAEKHLRAILQLKGTAAETAWARRTLAVLLAAAGDLARWREALALVDLRADADPPPTTAANYEEQRARAVVLASQKGRRNRLRAVALLQDMRARQPLTAEDQYLLAQLHEALGDWTAARGEMLQLVTANGANARYVAHYAHTLLRRGDAAEAELWVRKLEQLPEAQGSYVVVELNARLLAAQDRGPDVVAAVEKYLERDRIPSGQQPGRFGLVAALLEELHQRHAESKHRAVYAATAERIYRRLTDLDRGRVLDLVACLARQGRTGPALQLCEGAWEHCPPEAVGAACVAVLRGGQPSAAEQQQVEQWLTAALPKHPKAAPALHVCLADLRDFQGRYEEAEKLYRQAVAGDGRNVVALNNLAYLVALRGGPPAEALDLLNRAIALAGPTPELVDTRAVIFLKMGQPEQAIKELEEASADAALPALCYHLAQAQHLARNTTAARDSLRRAKGMGLRPDQVHALERATYQQLHAELDVR